MKVEYLFTDDIIPTSDIEPQEHLKSQQQDDYEQNRKIRHWTTKFNINEMEKMMK